MTRTNVQSMRAMHEAAHVVVCRHLGMTVTGCTLHDFQFRFVPPRSLNDPNLERYLTVMQAGHLASVLFFQNDEFDRKDRGRCIRQLLALGADDDRLQEAMQAARKSAVALVMRLRPAIERVAAALLEWGELRQADIDDAVLGRAPLEAVHQ